MNQPTLQHIHEIFTDFSSQRNSRMYFWNIQFNCENIKEGVALFIPCFFILKQGKRNYVKKAKNLPILSMCLSSFYQDVSDVHILEKFGD